ncbi:MAG: sulfur carrier protein ThiS [Candidatus Cloacimonetes bacterium]|jgi:thiamine biosynthesis protein ThiS|nr:sulfur carrier protein ThiS [Candidatus Cloacimonadota bacterium]MBT6993683.1 sulfur carrier protein ThiS [Candidatus Cloacimonadota bacterium]MBT7469646.1 sulfur carrier protein ThiS [Candidatus Cloacimonadota bacterium]
MIKINDTKIEWQENLSVTNLLINNNFIVKLSVVKIDGNFILKKEFNTTIVADNADVKVIHLVAGG